jgi:hypothetical protein
MRRVLRAADGGNTRLASAITSGVGTMWCAYAFTLLALVSLPAAIASGDLLVIVAWTAQTLIQLVLLPVIMVGQSIASAKTEAVITDTHREATVLLTELADQHADTHQLLRDVEAIARSVHATITTPGGEVST